MAMVGLFIVGLTLLPRAIAVARHSRIFALVVPVSRVNRAPG